MHEDHIESLTDNLIVEEIDEIQFRFPMLFSGTFLIWKPFFAFLTFYEILNTDTTLQRIFLGNYQPLLSRIGTLAHIIDVPDLDDLEITLSKSTNQLRKEDKSKIAERMRQWWEDFSTRLP